MGAEQTSILLVHNNAEMVRRLSKWLGSTSDVRSCDSSEEAVERVKERCPEIVFAGGDLPGMDVLELCRWLRGQSLPHYVYTILLGMPKDVVPGLDAGADDFLSEPVGAPEMLARLRSGLRVVALERCLSRQSQLDSLTGLPTQRTLYEQLQRNWGSETQSTLRLTCVMADIDSFKRINDTHGHLVGDQVIRQVARQLQEYARPGDVVSRYGGEEFCVILRDIDENQGEDWAIDVCKRISELQIQVHEVPIQVAASFGVATRTEDTRTPEQLVDRADQSMLVAKRSGRGSVVSFRSINESARLRAIAAGGPGGLFRGLLARHVMRIMVASLNQEETIGQAADFFLRFRISAAPVVDDDGRLVGYLSERDVIKIMLWPNCWSSKIKEVMETGVVCYDEDTPVLTIYDFLCRVSLRNVLILKNGRPTGILSRGSLLRWFYNSVVTPEEGTPGTGLHQSDTMSKGRAVDTARQLVSEAQEVVEGLKKAPDELVSCLVGGVSRMQELLNDLLAWSRFVNTTTNRAFTGWLADEGMPESEKGTENPDTRSGMAEILDGRQFPHSEALSDA